MKLGGQSVMFMVDTRAEGSVIITSVIPFTGQTATLIRATADSTAHSFCKARSCQQVPLVTHEFRYLLECPIPLLGRNLLTKLGVEITFAPRKHASLILWSQSALMTALTVPREDEVWLYSSEREQTNPTSLLKEFPAVWAEKGPPGLAKNHTLIMVDMKPRATAVRQRQYPVPQEACLRI